MYLLIKLLHIIAVIAFLGTPHEAVTRSCSRMQWRE
jgi:hypothetical protein